MKSVKTTRVRSTITVLLFLVGIILGAISLAAEFIGLDITPGFGIIQMFQLLLGLTCLTLASFLFLHSLRSKNAPRSLQADIGIRLAATGLVFTYASGFSDFIGIGTHVTPNFERAYVGPLQLGGITLGFISILAGLILYHTSRGSRKSSSMEFLINGDKPAG